MKNSTDFTKDILTCKTQKNILPCDNFVPFLVQKYISGVSPEHCNLINTILNSRLLVWKDEQEIYDFLKCFIPKRNSSYFKYFGKPLKNKEYKIDFETICQALEISEKELTVMIEYFPEIEESLKEDKEKILKVK
jgi:hypothetical protein